MIISPLSMFLDFFYFQHSPQFRHFQSCIKICHIWLKVIIGTTATLDFSRVYIFLLGYDFEV